jgi:hypothetical protein
MFKSNAPQDKIMKISRRQFIKTLSTGVFIAGTSPILGGCGGITRKDIRIEAPWDGYLFGADDRDMQILRYASLAPSALNAQPWFVRIVDRSRWIIGVDKTRRLPAVDPDNREILLSLGAFTENLLTAAAAMGLTTGFEVISQDPFAEDIIAVTLTPGFENGYPLERITGRRTVKKGFGPKELKTETVKALSAPLKDHFFYFPRGTEHALCIQDCLLEEYRRQMEKEAAQQEIVNWLRFSDKSAEKHLDGLTPESMEIDGLAGWYLRHFAEPGDFLKPAFRKKSMDHAAALADEGAGWIILTNDGSDVFHLIDTGRRFERMALLAREQGVGIHPMSQCLEEKEGIRHIQTTHEKNFNAQFLLRVGYLESYPSPVSLRRPAHWFLRT